MKFLSCVNVLVGYYVSNILLFSCTLTLVIVCTQACEATMETHTLARYFSEHSLQEYDFVMEKPSYVAAASMYLALRMKKLGGWVGQAWYNVVPFDLHPQFLSFSLSLSLSLPPSLQTPTLQHYSGYTVEEMLPMVKRLNTLIQKPLGQTCTVRSKYSHE